MIKTMPLLISFWLLALTRAKLYDPRGWTLFESARTSRAWPSPDMVSHELQEFACSHSALPVNRRPEKRISVRPPA